MGKKFLLLCVLFLGILVLTGCSNVQQEYYEVHILEDPAEFRFVNPDEGTDTLAQNVFENVATYPVYLYVPIEGDPFDQTQFYAFLGDYYLYRHFETGKYYIVAKEEMENVIFQFYLDKEAFEAGE